MTTLFFTSTALLAFASNALICRAALRGGAIDPAGFTTIRFLSASLVLILISRLLKKRTSYKLHLRSALALCAYAIFFSYAYVGITASAGSLIAFGAVQMTMMTAGLFRGERMAFPEWVGFSTAVAGLVYLVFPGLSAPPLKSSIMMFLAGAAWGVYSLTGVGSQNAIEKTTSNFIWSLPIIVIMGLMDHQSLHISQTGALWAVLSGGVASACGYILWYKALRGLTAMKGALVQLSVPVIAASGGVLLMGEQASFRLLISSVLVLGGIGFTIMHHLKPSSK